MVTVYVALRDEGVDVWRPVDAIHLGENLYQLLGQIPDGEQWEFPPGSKVRCEPKSFSGGEQRLTAIGED